MVKDELLGKQLASYILVESLGQGAFGSVYLGKHFLLSQKPPVAIKVLNTALNSQEEFDRFFQEAVILDELTHPNIMQVLDANLYEGYPFFVAEYAPGGSLRDRLDGLNGQPIDTDEAVRILQQIGRGLQHAHDMDVVHRDLKPANILFNARGDALLADFGIALQIQKTRRVDEIGTPAYMSPEQFKGKISKKSDQYALGCIAYEIFTGQQIFMADDPYTIGYKHIYEAPIEPRELNPDIPEGIEIAVLKALAKERDDRYESVSDFIQALIDATDASAPRKSQQAKAPAPQDQPGEVITSSREPIARQTQRGERGFIETDPTAAEGRHGRRNEPVTPPAFLKKRASTQTSQHATRAGSQLRPIWNTTSGLNQVYYSEPTVANGIVYAGTYNGASLHTMSPRHLRALDLSTGEHLWSYKTQYGIFEAPVVSEGLIYFASGNIEDGGKVSALDADTGELYWTVETEDNLKATPIVSNDIVYAYSRHAVYALNAATGQQYWNVTLKAPQQGRPLIANNVVYIATGRGHCYAVDAERGLKLASYADVGRVHAAVPFDEHVVCICAYNEQLYALDMQTGETYWSIPLENAIVDEIEISNGIAYFTTQGVFGNSTARTKMSAVELASGKQIWNVYLKNEADATPLVVDGLLYLTTRSAELYIFDIHNGKLIQPPLKLHADRMSRPYVANGWVIIANNEINAFQLA
ncbi:hypothetical protein KDH_67100 [Dictyobacter sp. S3.2.2.5]|uniref:non-specific serine/threonine protein kinase n=1 Tax=Dictyobacter halimunensis TaxID=3026934 RepID=A0ABQ6G057_9CHLR|nr:hypothetical protein KDH_67100 [Dictyobacter sp. S3.2.2.5]